MDLTPFTPWKLLRHHAHIEAMVRGEPITPIAVELDLSNICPHDCPFCSFGTAASGGYRQQVAVTFPSPRIFSLLDELATAGVQAVTFTGGGEPLVHREAAAIFERATAVGLAWGLVTNGLRLKGAVIEPIAQHARFVRVSLDAGTDVTHRFTHGTATGQFYQILSQLQALRALAGARLTIGVSFCVMDQNFKEIYAAAKLAKEAGANYLEVRPTFPTDWRGDGWGQALAPAHVEAALVELAHARSHLNDDHFHIIGLDERFKAIEAPAKRYQQCRIGPLMTVIGADGRGWHCCVQRGQPGFSYGTFATQSFTETWAARAKNFDTTAIDVTRCPRCRYDGYNELLEHAILEDGLHAAFL